MSRKRIGLLMVLGVIVATVLVVAIYAPAQAVGYGTSAATGKTGAEVPLLAIAGAGLITAGYFLTRKSKA